MNADKKRKAQGVLALVLVGVLSLVTESSWADGGGRGGGGGWRGGGGWGGLGLGVGLGVVGYSAWALNNPAFYNPYPAGYPVYQPPPTAMVYAPPAGYPVYQPPPINTTYVGNGSQGTGRDWFYCDSAKGYYPYVKSCPEPWHTVPSTPNGPVQP